ncbi:MAG: hypothetical protein RR074_12720, partial [Citrobacter sp.]
VKFGAILTGKANVCEPALHQVLCADFFSILQSFIYLFELRHENETGYSLVLETCLLNTQYRTETGFCFLLRTSSTAFCTE